MSYPVSASEGNMMLNAEGNTMLSAEGSVSRRMSELPIENQRNDHNLQQSPGPESSQVMFMQARQRCKIAKLEEKIETLESGRAVKERQTNYYLAQGRGFRRVVALFDSIEDLVSDNDRRYDIDGDDDAEAATVDQDRLHVGYHVLVQTLPWFVKSVLNMEHDDYMCMLKLLRQGADGARGDDTSKLKTLISDWVNCELKPNPPVDPDNKHCRGFVNDACGMLLCPAELDWNDSTIRTGIRDRLEGYVVTELSFPTFLYEKYSANSEDLEEGLFKGRILPQDIEGDGDGADVVENNRRAKKALSGIKVKKHVAQIIKIDKVTLWSIAYIACQVRFALSSVTLWRSVDGDFDYIQFWQTIVDFFEKPPGREVQHRVKKLLEWWTRKVFGRSRHEDLSNATKACMSVNTLARQRARRDDTALDSN
ncbi:uncharacterized protein F5147DRAFT_657584 [Suillus discolor]|uniref:Uncharacterized protein n=1 Tax=Suillus discolor TaxID=1912936 RepID=A0A9P7JNK9_9AGAM|nr:uncharacterized protein F5147DRAFT_657584 [Suillus discolor]KAG2092801.1 hypothetical protein F5147DRAFT_657584 [Suillus discolor]